MLTLYSTALSANGRKVLYRGEGRAAEYLAINPAGKIPALVDGDFTLCESNAILQYICEAHG